MELATIMRNTTKFEYLAEAHQDNIHNYYDFNIDLFDDIIECENSDDIVKLFRDGCKWVQENSFIIDIDKKTVESVNDNDTTKITCILTIKDGTKIYHSFYMHTSFFFLEDGSLLFVD